MARLHKNLRNDVGDLPPKVEALVTSADVDAGAPDWEALGALIDAELAARKKASGIDGRRRVNKKTAPNSASVSKDQPDEKKRSANCSVSKDQPEEKKSSADSPGGADGDASVPVSPVPAFEPPPRKVQRRGYQLR